MFSHKPVNMSLRQLRKRGHFFHGDAAFHQLDNEASALNAVFIAPGHPHQTT